MGGWSQVMLRPTRRKRDAPRAVGRQRFDAFISYSSDLDPRLAPALQRGLHRFAKPWYRTRALHVFRDTASLSANPALWPAIRSAIDASDAFILLAAPESASSRWVDKEVAYWCENRSTERLIVVLAGGAIVWDEVSRDFDWTMTTALPPSARGAFQDEPLYVDLSWARESTQLSPRDPRFRDALATIAAPLHRRSKDELVGDDVRQHRRTVRLVRSVVVTLAVLTTVAGAAAIFALVQRNQARIQRGQARSRGTAALATVYFPTRLDLALLLSVEAFRAGHTAEARGALLRGLVESDGVQGFVSSASGQAFTSVAYGPSTRTLAAGCLDGAVYVWNVATRRLVARFGSTSGGQINAVAYSPDGRRLAAASENGTAVVRDLTTPSASKTIDSADRSSKTAVAFSRNGTQLALGTKRGTIDIVPLRGGRPLVLRVPGGADVNSVAFGRGRVLAAGSNDGRVALWRDGRRKLLSRPGAAIKSVRFSADGRTLAAGGDAGLLLFNAQTGQPLPRLASATGDPITSVAFSPDGSFAAGSSRGAIGVWSLGSATSPSLSFQGDRGAIRGLAFSPDGASLAAASGDATVVIWDTRRRNAFSSTVPADAALVAYDGAGDLISAGRDGVTLWRDHHPLVLSGSALLPALAASAGGEIAAADGDGSVLIWELPVRSPQRLPTSDASNPVTVIGLQRDGTELAVGRNDGTVDLWRRSPRGWRKTTSVSTGHSAVRSIAFRSEGPSLVAGTADGSVLLLDRDHPRRAQVIARDGGTINVVGVSPDGRLLAVGSDDNTVDLWRLGSVVGASRRLGRLSGHDESVMTVAFSSDGATLATGGADGKLILWDSSTHRSLGDPLQRSDVAVSTSSYQVGSVAFSPDGSELAAATADGSLHLWVPLPRASDAKSVVTRLCRIASRNLTRSEWQDFFPDQHYHVTCPQRPKGT
jgi:WD40 repeat protein